MSVKLSSEQFKQDINSLFNRLHSLLTGLEAKIIERDESLREEVKQEILHSLLYKDDTEIPKIKGKKEIEMEEATDNPVSMVVPVNPNQFIGTTIKHTSNYISDQTINLTVRNGGSKDNLNTKPTPNCQNSTATNTPSTTVAANANATSTGNNNNSIIKSSSNSITYSCSSNGSNSSRHDSEVQDEPFKAIINSIGNINVEVPNVGASSSASSKETNNRVKENRCPMCAQRFTQLNSLKRHIRSHTGERPFPCGYCEKRFVDRERLKVHVRIHTGEKPFSCNLCSRRFSQKSTVKRHMSVHTGLKPFQCGSCSKRFGTRDNLRVHEKSHFQVDIKFKNINAN